jgi:hypothetical protein
VGKGELRKGKERRPRRGEERKGVLKSVGVVSNIQSIFVISAIRKLVIPAFRESRAPKVDVGLTTGQTDTQIYLRTFYITSSLINK